MIIVDASTTLVTMLAEPGHEASDALFETQPCAISLLNLSEVHDRLIHVLGSHREARARFDDLEMQVLPVDRDIAELAAILKQRTSKHGLGIADRICIATGMLHEARIFTADRAWAGLDIPEADITIVR